MDRSRGEIFQGSTCPKKREIEIDIYQHGWKCLPLVQVLKAKCEEDLVCFQGGVAEALRWYQKGRCLRVIGGIVPNGDRD